MDTTPQIDLSRDTPRPLAWTWATAMRERNPVARFNHLLKAWETTTRLMALIGTARYLTARPEEGHSSLDGLLRSLRRPSFGHWSRIMWETDLWFGSEHRTSLFGFPMNQRVADAALADFVCSGKKKTSLKDVFERVVHLRNRTAGHGPQTPVREAAAWNQELEYALRSLWTTLPELCQRKLLAVLRIEKTGHQRWSVHGVALHGTGLPAPMTVELADASAVIPRQVWWWPTAPDLPPIELSPLIHYMPDADRLYLLENISDGLPRYRSVRPDVPEHRPDTLVEDFKKRAGFLLEATDQPSVAPESSSVPLRAAFEAAVRQAAADGVLSQDEAGMLDSLQRALGLSDAEVGAMLDEAGLGRQPPAPNAVAAPPAPSTRSNALVQIEELSDADRLDEAMKVCRQRLREEPTDTAVRFALARLLVETSQLELAHAVATAGLRHSAPAPLHAVLSDIAHYRADVDTALSHAKRAMQADAEDIHALLAMYECHAAAGSIAGQEEVLAIAEKRFPDHVEVLLARSSLLSDPAKELELARRALQLAPRSRRAHFAHATALLSGSDPMVAARAFRRLVARNPSDAIHQAFLAISLGSDPAHSAEALEAAQRATTLLSRHPLGLIATAYVEWFIRPNESLMLERMRPILEGNVRNVAWRQFAGRVLVACGLPHHAEPVLRSVLQATPNRPDALVLLAEALEDLGRFTEALQMVERVPAAQRDKPDVVARLSSILIGLDRMDEARIWVDRMPTGAAKEALAVRLALIEGETTTAVQRAEDALQESPSDASLRVLLISGYCLSNRPAKAEHELGALPIPHTALRIMIANSWADLGRPDRAIAQLNAIDEGAPLDLRDAWAAAASVNAHELAGKWARRWRDEDPDNGEAWAAVGRCCEDEGDTEGAVTAYQTALDLDPRQSLALNNLAVIYGHAGDTNSAIDLLRVFLEDWTPQQSTTEMWNLALHLVDTGQYVEAVAKATTAHDADHSAERAAHFGAALLSAGESAVSLRWLESLAGEHPDSVEFMAKLTNAMREEGQYAEALRIVREVADRYPDSAQAHHCVALTYESMDRPREAAASYRRARELAPDDDEMAVHHADFLISQGRTSEARSIFEELLSRDELDADRLIDAWLTAFVRTEQSGEGLALSEELADMTEHPWLILDYQATFLLDLDRPGDALTTLETVEAPPKHMILTMARASAAHGDHERAEALYSHCIVRMKGDLTGIRLERLRSLVELEEWRSAEAECAELSSLVPEEELAPLRDQIPTLEPLEEPAEEESGLWERLKAWPSRFTNR